MKSMTSLVKMGGTSGFPWIASSLSIEAIEESFVLRENNKITFLDFLSSNFAVEK